MSLYTSSMNSSESNNYRLRMYVDEGYNPQGDGGGLTFSVRINVYGKAGDKYVPLTTQKILEDNELQEEKENMFNYASNGNYMDIDTYEEANNPEYVTNGLYSMEDEDGTSYYYRGNVDNNNVQFGEYASDYYAYYDGVGRYFQTLESCEAYTESISYGTCTQVKLASAGDKMYWKIVRINGDGSLRLIYNGTSATPDFSDLAHSYAIGQVPYNLEANDPKYTGYTYDRDTNETDSYIKREVDTWYENALGDTIYDSNVTGGRFCSDSSGYREESMIGRNVFASFDRLGSAYGKVMGLEMQENVTPTLKCPVTSESYGESYRLKAGLITVDELVLAGESLGVVGNSYLSIGNSNIYYWSMAPANFGTGDANVWGECENLRNDRVTDYNGVRPVINVTTENGFTSGDGTASSPYTIS